MWVVLENDLVDSCKAGDDVTVCGVVMRRWKPVFLDVSIKARLLCHKPVQQQVQQSLFNNLCTIAYKFMPHGYCKGKVSSAVAFTIGRHFFIKKSKCLGV